MSDISISASTPLSMAYEDMASGIDSVKDTTSIVGSGLNEGGPDTMEKAVAGIEVASRTEEFFGASADFGSTGTDIDIQQAVSRTLNEGMGVITDTVA